MAYIGGRQKPISDEPLCDVGNSAKYRAANRVVIDDELELDYDMSHLQTVATFETLQLAHGDESQRLDAAATLLAGILTGWNLTNNGQPVECSRATIEQRGLKVLVYCLVHLKPYFNKAGTSRASVTAGVIVKVLVDYFQAKGH
ncbi:MAG TPA: hypothetical protein VJX74_08350 [Blastocatellia bacterium]|nr:hypothetical protein [Blastocatellia bacterium]